MAYALDTISPASERASLITGAAGSTAETLSIPFGETYRRVPVVSLPIGVPVYRSGNGRLAVLETSYLGEHNLPDDHFDAGEEKLEIQRILHGFLSELSEHPEGPIKAELERSAQQTEPLLITADGIVVNGNRRLSAMRDLYGADPARYAEFSNIEAAVLPEATSSVDLEMIEAALQMAPETKLAYGWIERRLKLRQQRGSLGLSDQEICESYRFKDASQIDVELGELELAEAYLSQFVKTPENYRRIDWAEEPFVALRERLESCGYQLEPVWRAVGFCLISAAETDEQMRPIKVFPFAKPKPNHAGNMLLHRLGGEIGLWERRPDNVSFDPPSRPDLQRLTDALSDAGEAAAHAARILELYEEIAADHRDRPSPHLVMRQMNRLSKLMAKVDSDSYSPEQRAQLSRQVRLIRQFYSTDDPDTARARPRRRAERGLMSKIAAKIRSLTGSR